MPEAKAAETTTPGATTSISTPSEKPSAELTDDDLDKVSGGMSILTNLSNMRHEMDKSIAGNLRG